MALQPIFKKAYWVLVAGGAFYFTSLLVLTNVWVQRQLENQISALNISTPDGERLYAWHILPVAVYARNEQSLIKQGLAEDYATTESFKLLANDPESRLVNAGHVGQGWRTDAYRTISSGAADKIHVISVDYRGFGYSTGSPTEEGVIIDAVATINWALTIAKIPPERILLLGTSLGTAVATAAAEHFSKTTPQVDFAGLVLVAGFPDIPTLMLTYNAGGVFPILSPLRPYPILQKWFAGRIADKWNTADRLANYVRTSRRVKLFLIHSKNDHDISWAYSDVLFFSAANATSRQGMTLNQVNNMKAKFDLGEAGLVNTWHTPNKTIRQEILRYGGMSSHSLCFGRL